MFILRSIAAMVLAFVIYLIAATAVGFLLAWEYRDWGFLSGIIGFVAALIGAAVGIAFAKMACDALLKAYSGKAVCILFVIFSAVFLADLLIHKDQFEMLWIQQIMQAILSAAASFFVFWKDESVFSSTQTT